MHRPHAHKTYPKLSAGAHRARMLELMRRFALGLIAILALPASAAAKGHTHTIAPPGDSGVQQYVETIPTARGGQPTSSVHRGGSGSGHSRGGGGGSGASGGGSGGGSAISPSTQRALDSQGADGRAAAAVLSATAPTGAGSTTSGQGAGGSATSGGGSTKSGSNAGGSPGNGASPASAVFHTLTGSTSSGGLGSLLPIILVGSLLAVTALAVLRRRRTTT